MEASPALNGHSEASRHSLIIAIDKYSYFPDVPGAKKDAEVMREVVGKLGAFEQALELTGRVSRKRLQRRVTDFLKGVDHDTHEAPIVLVQVSCNAKEGKDGLPDLICTNTQRGIEFQDQVYSIRGLVDELDKRKFSKPNLQTVFVFDCNPQECEWCIPPLQSEEDHPGPPGLVRTLSVAHAAGREASVVVQYSPSLQPGTSMLLSCDVGRRADHQQGGALLQKFAHIVTQRKTIDKVLQEVGSRTYNGGHMFRHARVMSCQLDQVVPPTLGRLDVPKDGELSAMPDVPITQSQKTVEKIVVVLGGDIGVGKSTMGNILLGEKPFKVSDEAEAETMFPQFDDAKDGLRIIDTPGFLDNRMPAKDNLDMWGQFVSHALTGVDVFLVLIKGGRSVCEQTEAFQRFKQSVSQTALKHCIAVFSKQPPKSELCKAEDPRAFLLNLEGEKRASHRHMVEIADEVAAVVFVPNNPSLTEDTDVSEKVRKNIEIEVTKLIKRNKGEKYQNCHVVAARGQRSALEKLCEKKNIPEPKREDLKKKLELMYNGKMMKLEEVLKDAVKALEDAEAEQEKERAQEEVRRIEEARLAEEQRVRDLGIIRRSVQCVCSTFGREEQQPECVRGEVLEPTSDDDW